MPNPAYPWAVNESKLQRAIAKAGSDPEAVKAEYIRIGGLVDEEAVPAAPTKKGVTADVQEPETTDEADTTKKAKTTKK